MSKNVHKNTVSRARFLIMESGWKHINHLQKYLGCKIRQIYISNCYLYIFDVFPNDFYGFG